MTTELRARRVEAGLTQQQLANRAALSVRTVQGLESGEFTRPRSSTLRRIDAALRAVRASQPDRDGRPYAGHVPAETAPNGDQTSRSDAASGLSDRYARPARVLATAPTRDQHQPLFWLEVAASATVRGPGGLVSEPRVHLCRAVPVDLLDRRAWRTTVLAPGVRPLDGVELVDALRAFRSPDGR